MSDYYDGNLSMQTTNSVLIAVENEDDTVSATDIFTLFLASTPSNNKNTDADFMGTADHVIHHPSNFRFQYRLVSDNNIHNPWTQIRNSSRNSILKYLVTLIMIEDWITLHSYIKKRKVMINYKKIVEKVPDFYPLGLLIDKVAPEEILQKVINLDPDALRVPCTYYGGTPLHLACRRGISHDTIRLMTSISARNEKNKKNNRSSVVSTSGIHAESLFLITNDRGETPLHHCILFACEDNSSVRKETFIETMKVIHFICLNEPKTLKVQDKFGNTPCDTVQTFSSLYFINCKHRGVYDQANSIIMFKKTVLIHKLLKYHTISSYLNDRNEIELAQELKMSFLMPFDVFIEQSCSILFSNNKVLHLDEVEMYIAKALHL